MTYKLQYFAFRYLGEIAKLIFHYAGQEFEDEQLTSEEWAKLKPETLFGTVPILTIDGKEKIGQSMAIYHFLAKRFNLAGQGDVEIAKVEAIGDYVRDFMNSSLQYVLFDIYKKEGDKVKLQKEILEVNIRKYCPTLIKLLKSSKSGFFADSGLTWVDFLAAEYIDSLNYQVPHYIKDYPELLEYSKKVHAVPQLQKYLSTRKFSPW